MRGGGFKCFLFSSLFGEDVQFDEHIFQMGWFNHQPECEGRRCADARRASHTALQPSFDGCASAVRLRPSFRCRVTWRIIPFSKWLVTPIYKPFRPFGRGIAPFRGLTNHSYINHLLNGMILQGVGRCMKKPLPETKKVNNPTKKLDMRWKSWNSSHFFWDDFCNNQNSTFLSGHFSIGRGFWKIKGWWERQDLTSWFLALTQEVKASLRRSYDSLIGQEGLGRALSVGAAQGRGFEAFSGLSQTNLKEAWWPLKNLSMVSQMSLSASCTNLGEAMFCRYRRRGSVQTVPVPCLKTELCMIWTIWDFWGYSLPFWDWIQKKEFHMNLPASYKWSFGAPTKLAENSRVTAVISSCF